MVPDPMATKVKLTYFKVHGRAFVTRFALRYAKFPYEDERLEFAELKERRSEKGYNEAVPIGYLPILQLNGEVVCESQSLARWAAKKSDLYPANPDEALLVDEAMELAAEIVAKAPQDPDKEVKKAKRAEFAATVCPRYLDHLERRIAKRKGTFLLGSQLTVADVAVYRMVDAFLTGDFDFVDGAAVLKPYPHLLKLHATLKAHPLVIAEEATVPPKPAA